MKISCNLLLLSRKMRVICLCGSLELLNTEAPRKWKHCEIIRQYIFTTNSRKQTMPCFSVHQASGKKLDLFRPMDTLHYLGHTPLCYRVPGWKRIYLACFSTRTLLQLSSFPFYCFLNE